MDWQKKANIHKSCYDGKLLRNNSLNLFSAWCALTNENRAKTSLPFRISILSSRHNTPRDHKLCPEWYKKWWYETLKNKKECIQSPLFISDKLYQR